MSLLLWPYITEIERGLLIYKKEIGKSKRAMAWWLRSWIPNSGVPGLKLLNGSKVNLAFHPYKADKMSAKKSWGPSGKD